ncbi:unnamed protein product, partial [Nesidiocoris tenuis]
MPHYKAQTLQGHRGRNAILEGFVVQKLLPKPMCINEFCQKSTFQNKEVFCVIYAPLVWASG